jgi:hypothetical protein
VLRNICLVLGIVATVMLPSEMFAKGQAVVTVMVVMATVVTDITATVVTDTTDMTMVMDTTDIATVTATGGGGTVAGMAMA